MGETQSRVSSEAAAAPTVMLAAARLKSKRGKHQAVSVVPGDGALNGEDGELSDAARLLNVETVVAGFDGRLRRIEESLKRIHERLDCVEDQRNEDRNGLSNVCCKKCYTYCVLLCQCMVYVLYLIRSRWSLG